MKVTLLQRNAGISVRFESKPCFLLALCVHCMEAHTVYQCVICGSCEWAPWTRMIVGGVEKTTLNTNCTENKYKYKQD